MTGSERHPVQDCEQHEGQRDKKKESHETLDVVLREICRRGFYGSAHVEITVQDGIIQRIRHEVTRVGIRK